MKQKSIAGKVRKERGKDSWYIRYCFAGRRGEVRFGKSEGQEGKYFCYVGAHCWYADSFDEAVKTCRDEIARLGGFVD